MIWPKTDLAQIVYFCKRCLLTCLRLLLAWAESAVETPKTILANINTLVTQSRVMPSKTSYLDFTANHFSPQQLLSNLQNTH